MNINIAIPLYISMLCLVASSLPLTIFAAAMDSYQIGAHGKGHVKHPEWFKQSLLDLQGDLEDARDAGKRGIIVLFTQKNCSHCQAFIETTLQDKDTQRRIRKNFDVIGLDIFNDNELTNIDGTVTNVKNFAEAIKARLTPTLLFIGIERNILLKIIGLYPPEKFNRVLDYIENSQYKNMTLSAYLQIKTVNNKISKPVQYDFTLFEKPPLMLNKTPGKSARPLLVVFENPDCNPCSRFHERILNNQVVRSVMGKFRAVQLDASDRSQKIIAPDGAALTPQLWAKQLHINYDIAVVFFDAQGKEVHRIDSETGKDRMLGSMQYVLEKAYKSHEQFLQWRKEQALKQNKRQSVTKKGAR